MYKENRCYDMPINDGNMSDPKAMMNGCGCPPVMECPQERVCHREINCEVQHVVPIHTRVVNHYIYRHSYVPCFTCSEENEVCNVCEPRCGF